MLAYFADKNVISPQVCVISRFSSVRLTPQLKEDVANGFDAVMKR